MMTRTRRYPPPYLAIALALVACGDDDASLQPDANVDDMTVLDAVSADRGRGESPDSAMPDAAMPDALEGFDEGVRDRGADAAVDLGFAEDLGMEEGMRVDPPGSGAHAYYDLLAAHPQAVGAVSYRSMAEIEADLHGRRNPVRYDATEDAADFVFQAGGPANAAQIRHPLAGRPYNNARGGTLLTYWEVKWTDFWTDPPNQTHKAFQFANREDGSLGLYWEPRVLYGRACEAGEVGYLDIRAYGGVSTGLGGDRTPCGGNYGSGSVSPHANNFAVMPEVWTRFWMFIDWDENRFSYWAADDDRAPVIVFDGNEANFGDDLQRFVFEFNTSQDEPMPREAHIYGRNLVYLADISLGEVEPLVAAYEPGTLDR
ncbi:MAG: hypothetical protein AAF411_08540 [Myxococcota bacterium]